MITGKGLLWLGWGILILIVARTAWKVTGGRGPGRRK